MAVFFSVINLAKWAPYAALGLFDARNLWTSLALAPLAPSLGIPQRLEVLERGVSGRVLALAITGSAGRQVLRLDGIRRSLRQLPSTLFSVSPEGPGVWRFSGGGFGHGAGLSQAGAIDLAARGWSLERILARYYPGTALVPIGGLGNGP